MSCTHCPVQVTPCPRGSTEYVYTGIFRPVLHVGRFGTRVCNRTKQRLCEASFR
ncbi:hypothetical protein BDZ91DRAFT_748166 [Kalaharituber pfeilii]|nr:hypothetical protein BDZ91DRAFT_748166 [Kalaharituber pfeilii]